MRSAAFENFAILKANLTILPESIQKFIDMYSLTQRAITEGGRIFPLTLPPLLSQGWPLFNPSVTWSEKDELFYCALRTTNFILDPALPPLKKHKFLGLGNEEHFESKNFIVVLTKDFSVSYGSELNMLESESSSGNWRGIEDLRLVWWEGKLYAAGTRRDHSEIGEGRIELLEIGFGGEDNSFFERRRLPLELEPEVRTQCEKNWMPVAESPFTFIRWTIPTEKVHFEMSNKRTCVTLGDQGKVTDGRKYRGGSQIVRWNSEVLLSFVHEVFSSKSYLGDFQFVYLHRLVVWDNNLQVIGLSPRAFPLIDSGVEFVAGACRKGSSLILSFGFQDSAALALEVTAPTVESLIAESLNNESFPTYNGQHKVENAGG